jgi:hypothetical protein
VLGAILGLAVILFFFAQNIIFALLGFAVFVVSVSVLVPYIRERLVPGDAGEDDADHVV